MNESTALKHSARASLHLLSLQRCFQTLLVLKAPLAPETPPVQHGLVVIPSRARGGEHLLTSEDGVGTGHEGHGLLSLTELVSTSGETNNGLGKDDTGCSDGSEDGVNLDRLVAFEWSTRDRDKCVNGERFRVLGHPA